MWHVDRHRHLSRLRQRSEFAGFARYGYAKLQHRFVWGVDAAKSHQASGCSTGSVAGVTVRAMVLDAQGQPLVERELPRPELQPGQVRLRVHTCGVCRTDLHIRDGELREPKLPLVLGHQIVGTVIEGGEAFSGDERVGVPWLGWTDGECRYCRSGRENLCDRARFTGYHRDGGYAELAVADERFCTLIPDDYEDLQAAPLLCAGLIGYRALRLAGDGERLGLYGFGASAHIVAQVARHEGRRVFAFTRAGDDKAQSLALALGAEWAGEALAPGPEELDAAIIFAPAGELVPAALRATAKGATVVCAGIHMSDIPSFPYELLWEERVLRSVANLTRRDAEEFLALAPQVPVRTEVESFPLEQANEALSRLRAGDVRGAAVLAVARVV
jgi:alcohol dehydrogenase, propanol-preferring